VRRSNVRASALGKPTNGVDNALVFLLPLNECRVHVIFIGLRACIDWEAGGIRSGVGGYITEVNVIVLDKVGRESSLAEMDLDKVRGYQPLEVCTKEPIDCAHEINGGLLLE